jgi:tetratricopeptide (TPR) repeat protein
MATDVSTDDRESTDAATVNAAVDLLAAGDIVQAESLLGGVIANTPPTYTSQVEDGDAVAIKFWDEASFVHYVMWQKQQGGAVKAIRWIGNAYPRAHYYMGFIGVKKQDFDRAIAFLDKGHALEPTNPKFAFEKAQALVHSGRKHEALALYSSVTEIGPFVGARDLAIARRGRGFVLIELQDLDGAEAAFRASLELEPGNEIALNEVEYIRHLRQGGAASAIEAVPSVGRDLSVCAACGSHFEDGVVIALNGVPVGICARCKRSLTKKWWQFWK